MLEGGWGIAIPRLSLGDSVSALDGEAKAEFLNFIKSMLKWFPEERKRASELLEDPWMAEAKTY